MNNEEIIKNAYRINRIYSTFVMIKVFIMFLLFLLATYLPAFFYFHKDPLFWWNCNEIWMYFVNTGFILYFYLDFCEYINIFIRPRRIIKRFCKDEASTKIVSEVINKPLLLTKKRSFKWWFLQTDFRHKWIFCPIFIPWLFALTLFVLVWRPYATGGPASFKKRERWDLTRIVSLEYLGKSYLRMKWEVEDGLNKIKEKELENK